MAGLLARDLRSFERVVKYVVPYRRRREIVVKYVVPYRRRCESVVKYVVPYRRRRESVVKYVVPYRRRRESVVKYVVPHRRSRESVVKIRGSLSSETRKCRKIHRFLVRWGCPQIVFQRGSPVVPPTTANKCSVLNKIVVLDSPRSFKCSVGPTKSDDSWLAYSVLDLRRFERVVKYVDPYRRRRESVVRMRGSLSSESLKSTCYRWFPIVGDASVS